MTISRFLSNEVKYRLVVTQIVIKSYTKNIYVIMDIYIYLNTVAEFFAIYKESCICLVKVTNELV